MATFLNNLTGFFNTQPSYDTSLFPYFTTPSLYNNATQNLYVKASNTKSNNPTKANQIKDILINSPSQINAPLLSVNDFNQVKTYGNQMQPQMQYSPGQSLATIPNAQLQIVTEINKLKDNNFVFTLNTTVQVDLDKLFQVQMQQTSHFQKLKNLKNRLTGNKQISLLALACLLGLEGVVAYFVYNGAIPGELNNNNKDTGYIFIYNQIKNGLLTLNKLKLILLILCSVKNGAALSRLAKGQIKSNGKSIETQKSVLHLLVENFLLPVSDSQADLQKSNRVQALVTLGFQPNANPSPQNITRAYRQLALQIHPNKTQNTTKDQFQRVKEAYDYLSQQQLPMAGGDTSTAIVPYGQLQGQSLQSLPGQKYLGYELLKFILQANSQRLPNKSVIEFYSDINALSTPSELSPLFTLLLFPPDFSRVPQSSSNPLSEIVQLFLDKKASTTSIPNPKQISSFNICEFLQIDTRLDQNTKKVLMSNNSIQKTCNTTFGMSQNQQKFKELQKKYNTLLTLYARTTGQSPNRINQSLSPSYNYKNQQTSMQNQQSLVRVQNAGAKATLRTFHFADNKKYSHNVFRAIRPINAGRLAFEFIRDHYRIGGREIVFTIIDKHNKKHYKYVARNDKKLGVVIHTA